MKIDQYSFQGKRAIVRVDFNVPLNDKFQVTDDTRIRSAIPTIKKISSDGGICILMSHLGRPKNGPENKFSLKHLVPHLSALLSKEIHFVSDCVGTKVEETAAKLQAGDILLLENLRFYAEETKGDREFASKLAKLADVYVNDAFGTAHRAHASTTIIADFFPKEKMFGYVIEGELSSINKVLNQAQKPFTAILGGAKVSTKITIIEKLLPKIDHLIIGGGMMFTFIKALGGKIGSSLIEEDKLDLALEIIEKAKAMNVELHIPVDCIAADQFANDANSRLFPSDKIDEGWMGLDIGPESITQFKEIIMSSKTILWNGPMGVFEMENFAKGTKEIAFALAGNTEKGGFTLIGGGDSVAAINQFDLANQVSYVSTGGGALLEYIEGKELPGIAAINSTNN